MILYYGEFFYKIVGTIWRVSRISTSLAAKRGRGRRMGGAPGICGLSALLGEGSGGRLSADGTGHSHSNSLRFGARDGRRLYCRRLILSTLGENLVCMGVNAKVDDGECWRLIWYLLVVLLGLDQREGERGNMVE